MTVARLVKGNESNVQCPEQPAHCGRSGTAVRGGPTRAYTGHPLAFTGGGMRKLLGCLAVVLALSACRKDAAEG
ncbi:hypothetical protein FH620_37805, partial [Corallococcus exiguus]